MIYQYQGEYPDSQASESGQEIDSRKVIIIIVAGLVLIGLAAGLIFFMGGNDTPVNEEGVNPSVNGDKCGDGKCGDKENCASCAKDCGCQDGLVCSKDFNKCVKKEDESELTAEAVCGDDICDESENCFDCSDCKCKNGEYCSSTDKKCVSPECGDGMCEPNESPESCCIDCACMSPGEECNQVTKKCETVELGMSEERAEELAVEYYENLGNTVESVDRVEPWTWEGENIYLVEVRIEGQEWTYKAGVYENGDVKELPVF